MICPLLALAFLASPEYSNDIYTDESYKECMGKRCAWWHRDYKQCALLTIMERQ